MDVQTGFKFRNQWYWILIIKNINIKLNIKLIKFNNVGFLVLLCKHKYFLIHFPFFFLGEKRGRRERNIARCSVQLMKLTYFMAFSFLQKCQNCILYLMNLKFLTSSIDMFFKTKYYWENTFSTITEIFGKFWVNSTKWGHSEF